MNPSLTRRNALHSRVLLNGIAYEGQITNNIIYIVGLIVIIGAVLAFFGLR